MEDLDQQREVLREQVQQEEQELRQAVEDLKEAVRKPFRIIERVQANPVPWMLSGALLGIWLGSRTANDRNDL